MDQLYHIRLYQILVRVEEEQSPPFDREFGKSRNRTQTSGCPIQCFHIHFEQRNEEYKDICQGQWERKRQSGVCVKGIR